MIFRPLARFGAAVLCFSIAGASAQSIIHVGPQGDDAADGSAARPFATLHAAQGHVRGVLAAGAQDVRVEIAAGDYFLAAPLEFTPVDSGPSVERPVTYAAVGGAVRISGGQKIGGWATDGRRWTAKLKLAEVEPPIRDLWVNGRRAIRARAPNEDYFRVEHAGPDNRTSFTVAPAELLALAKPQAAEVGFMHDWSMSRVRLASIDPAARTYHFADRIGGDETFLAITGFEAHPRYFVENAPELLDAPGEWFLDETTGELTYIPREGETIETAEVIAPRLEQLVVVRGEGETPARNLTFEGLTFSHTRFELPPHGYAGVQAAWHSRRLETNDDARVIMISAVLVDNAEGCRFTNCTFEHLASCGLHTTHSRQARIDRCTFRDIGGDGILIGSRDMNEKPFTEGVVVEDCLVENCGATFYGAVGIWLAFAADVTAAYNEVRDLPYTGVSVGWQWDDAPTPCRGHRIHHNHIHHVMRELSDGGGIYTLGRQPGTQLANNAIHDVPANAGRAESNGIFMDQGSTEIEVAGNTIYNVARGAIRFHMAGPNLLKENRLVTPPGIPAFTYNATDPAVMTYTGNDEIAAASWAPPAGDAVLEQAGPRNK